MPPSSKLAIRTRVRSRQHQKPEPPQPAPGDWTSLRGERRMAAGAAALVAVAGLTVAASLAQRLPAPQPASAPPSQFSAERAWAHLERITGDEPTPVGSAAGDDIRDYLVAQLSALGLETEVQRGTGIFTSGGVSAGRVENVIATLPGRDSTGRLLVAAHYDTTFGSPGATDDKASVAAILEVARALTHGEPLRNDVVFLLSDGEEPGMLGASAFAGQHRYGPAGDVLLNWEGPGNAGSSELFQTSTGAAGVIEGFAKFAPYPVGTSMVPSLFHLLPNHTDLTVLEEAGWEGATWGFADGRAYYHSAEDTVDAFNRASLQQHGANLLALARGFGELDLATVHSSTDVTFFSVFGVVVRYPGALVWPLAGLAVALVVGLGLLARRRRLVTLPRLLAGAAAGMVPIVLAVAGAVGLWALLVWLRPGYAAMLTGDPYRPELYRWALGALAVTVVLAWYLPLRRRIGAGALAAGALLWPALVGVGCAALVPGMSYVGALPAATAALGGLVAIAVRPGWSRVVVLAAGIAPGVMLLVAAGQATLRGLGIAVGAGGALFFVLAVLVALPLVELVLPAAGRRRVRILTVPVALPVMSAVLTAVLVGAGLAVDRFDPEHPRPTQLMYVMNAETGKVRWASTDAVPHEWVSRHAPDRAGGDGALPLPYRADPRWAGAAEATSLPAPELTVLGSRTDGNATELTVEITSRRDADVLTLFASDPVSQVGVTADGHPPVTSNPEYPAGADRPWPFQLRFYDPPADGVRLRLRVPDTAGLRLSLSDYTVGLAGLPGYAERPPTLTRSSAHWSDLVVVSRSYRVEEG